MGKKQLVETSHIVADFGQLIPSYLVALIFGDLGCALGAIPALLIGHDDRPEPPPSRRFPLSTQQSKKGAVTKAPPIIFGGTRSIIRAGASLCIENSILPGDMVKWEPQRRPRRDRFPRCRSPPSSPTSSASSCSCRPTYRSLYPRTPWPAWSTPSWRRSTGGGSSPSTPAGEPPPTTPR